MDSRVQRSVRHDPDGLCPSAQKDMGRAFARDIVGAFIAQGMHIDAIPEVLARSE